MRTFNLTIPTPRHWKLGAIFAFLLLISFSPAHAMRAPVMRDGGYLSVSGGALIPSGGQVFGIKIGPKPTAKAGFNLGLASGSYIGSNARLEIALAYSRSPYEYKLDNLLGIPIRPPLVIKGISSYVTYQANIYYSFVSAPSPHEVFIGLGLGGRTLTKDRPDQNKTDFIFNLIAGYKYFINENFALGVAYHFIGDKKVLTSQLHNISATITFAF